MTAFHLRPFVFCAFAFVLSHPLIANEELAAKVRAFEKKTAALDGSGAERSPARMQSAPQLKTLAALLSRGDYEKARQLIGSVGVYDLSPELQQEWLEIAAAMNAELDKLKAAALEEWRVKVDALVKEAREACLAAKSSADIDPILVRCAALQMQRLGQENVLGQRAARKLAGVIATLESWMNFLDFRAANNGKAANDILRTLAANQTQFPVVTIPEIQAHFTADEAGKLTMQQALAHVYAGVKTPDELPAAIDRLGAVMKDPMNPELQSLNSELTRLETLRSAWDAAKKGADDAASRALAVVQTYGMAPEMQVRFEQLRNQVARRALESSLKAASGLELQPDEDLAVYARRVLDRFQEKGDYAAMLTAMKSADALAAPGRPDSFAQDRLTIENFLSAQRFEAIGDILAAVTGYRLVVGASGGRYAPTKPAGEALQRLREKHPDVFKDFQGVVLEELRQLRQQIQAIGRMSPGRPYPFSP
jgi:hypothetical protein